MKAITDADIPHVARDPAPSAVLMEIGHGLRALRACATCSTTRCPTTPTDSPRARARAWPRSRATACRSRSRARSACSSRTTRRIARREHARELARRLAALAHVDLFAPLSDAERAELAEHLVYAPVRRRATSSRARARSRTGSTSWSAARPTCGSTRTASAPTWPRSSRRQRLRRDGHDDRRAAPRHGHRAHATSSATGSTRRASRRCCARAPTSRARSRASSPRARPSSPTGATSAEAGGRARRARRRHPRSASAASSGWTTEALRCQTPSARAGCGCARRGRRSPVESVRPWASRTPRPPSRRVLGQRLEHLARGARRRG